MTPGPGDVLVLRALGLGDALTGVPALRGARRAWPGVRLWLAGPRGPGEWLRSLGVVDEVVPTQGLGAPIAWEGRGHVALDLHGCGPESHGLLAATRPARLVAFACPGFSWRAPDGRPFDGPAWDGSEHEVDRWCRLLRSAGGDCGRDDLRLDVGAVERSPDEVLLHPGAASISPRWPPDRWATVAAALLDQGRRVTLTGGSAERALCEGIAAAAPGARAVAGELSVASLARRVAAAGLLVCGDTGVAHMATAVGTPSVLLFGPTPPSLWGPAVDQERHRVLWHGRPGLVGDPHGASVDPALWRVTPEEVLGAVAALSVRRPDGVIARTTRRFAPDLLPR